MITKKGKDVSTLPVKAWQQEIYSLTSLDRLEALRVRLLGKNGELTQQLKTLRALTPEDRREKGAALNQAKLAVSEALEMHKKKLSESLLRAQLAQESQDISLPIRPQPNGTLHPIQTTIDEVVSYFSQLGFTVETGPDIEDEAHNFTALNIPEHHPARQLHDTFYFKGQPNRLLRTHTSPVQIRSMRQGTPPFRLLSPGRVYRCDSDATHTPQFHQVEGLLVDKKVHMGHLKGCLQDFCRHFFKVENLPVRFRPSFFPFTEPSAEVDIGCYKEGSVLKIGRGKSEKGTGWLEILGCGMVHPAVLKNCGIDPDAYQGFAFGMGIERLAMLKYGVPDIRAMFASDCQWLKHYGFSPFQERG